MILNEDQIEPTSILPPKYKWARESYRTGVSNSWFPEEVGMQKDVEDWKHPTRITADMRRMVLYTLGMFSTAEILTGSNIALVLYRYITNPECRQALLRVAFEEAVHQDTFTYCCDTLGIEYDTVYGAWRSIPSIGAKDNFVLDTTKAVMTDGFTTSTTKGVQDLLRCLVSYALVMEGVFFYAGFAMMLALKRQNIMVGIGEQMEFIMRDETNHLRLGANIINTIASEYPEAWTESFKAEVIEIVGRGVELEKSYAQSACPRGVLGMNARSFSDYVECMADRRLGMVGLPTMWGTANPFPWMGETAELGKEKNFFETRVTEYQTSANLEW